RFRGLIAFPVRCPGREYLGTMRMTKYVLRYAEKRSAHFQSVDISGEVTIELDPADDFDAAHQAALRQLVPRIRRDADRAIERYRRLD
ncbi:MAG: hypothetical protein ACKO5K_14320, partial [Armatimonadota bacterium]